jgi:ribonuclease HI
LVQVDDVYKIKFGNTNAYLIIRDPIQVVKNKKYPEEIKKAESAMYKISPSWRGTHEGNFGMQNNKVVLYDGFCKKAKVDETKIPSLEL